MRSVNDGLKRTRKEVAMIVLKVLTQYSSEGAGINQRHQSP